MLAFIALPELLSCSSLSSVLQRNVDQLLIERLGLPSESYLICMIMNLCIAILTILYRYVLYLFLVVGTVFIPNDPLFQPIFLWIARVGSVLFILLQQVILIDIGYNWNESWLAKSDQAELDEGPGKGKKWLGAILVSCAILYICSLAGIIIMYIHFSGCQSNNAFISITLILSLTCTVVQLTISETGSLLTSGCMTIYATYLCGAAVARKSAFVIFCPML